MKPPFANPNEEIIALKERSEFYEARLSALRCNGNMVKHSAEILSLHKLNQQCQGAIAFYTIQKINHVDAK